MIWKISFENNCWNDCTLHRTRFGNLYRNNVRLGIMSLSVLLSIFSISNFTDYLRHPPPNQSLLVRFHPVLGSRLNLLGRDQVNFSALEEFWVFEIRPQHSEKHLRDKNKCGRRWSPKHRVKLMTREQEKSPSSHKASKEPKNFEIYKIQTYYSFVIFEIKKINKRVINWPVTIASD